MEVWYLFVAASLVGFFNGISPTGITLLVLSLKNKKTLFLRWGFPLHFL